MATATESRTWVSGRAVRMMLQISTRTWRQVCYTLPIRRLEVPGSTTRWHRGDAERLLADSIKQPSALAG
jgi:hypothetical protein